jgi:hypothetical protein
MKAYTKDYYIFNKSRAPQGKSYCFHPETDIEKVFVQSLMRVLSAGSFSKKSIHVDANSDLKLNIRYK